MRVRVLPHNVEVECSPGELLSDVIKRAVPEFPTPCGGRGFCGKCAVRVIEGELTPPTGNELLHGLSGRVRLAC
ncbi:MAG: ferredoxin, partial [Thermoprotei archaeon]